MKRSIPLRELDHQIIELIGGLEEEGMEALIEKEIERSDEVHKDLDQIVLRMEEVLSKTNSSLSLNQVPIQETPPPMAEMAQQHAVKAESKSGKSSGTRLIVRSIRMIVYLP